MKVQLISDLHLERYPEFMPVIAPQAEVLVLAGDIGSYQSGSMLPAGDFGLGRFAPAAQPCPRVLFVPGNHEFDSLEYADTYRRLQDTCASLGIEWLERQVVEIGATRFIGSTLWADFDALASKESSQTQREIARQKAFRAANFYLSKNTTLKAGAPVLAEGIREMALEAQAWLAVALDEPHEGSTVVVTHFAPSLRSADPRYGLVPGTAGFCNALDHLVVRADVWMHGHLHCHNDYTIDGARPGRSGGTRVVANPRGYASKGEQAAFREAFVVDV